MYMYVHVPLVQKTQSTEKPRDEVTCIDLENQIMAYNRCRGEKHVVSTCKWSKKKEIHVLHHLLTHATCPYSTLQQQLY